MKSKSPAYRIKQLRTTKGLSQEELAHRSGLSLRTIQRIENGESNPHGDSLNKLVIALGVSTEEIIEWQLKEDLAKVTLLNLSQLAFLAFPILGIVLPLLFWLLHRGKIKHIDAVGKSVLNFQISWSIVLFVGNAITIVCGIIWMGSLREIFLTLAVVNSVLFLYNLYMVLKNTYQFAKQQSVQYVPAYPLLK